MSARFGNVENGALLSHSTAGTLLMLGPRASYFLCVNVLFPACAERALFTLHEPKPA